MRSTTLPDPYRTLLKSQISPARQQLLVLMERLRFGRIEGLLVLNAEPQFDPLPRLVRDVKLASDDDHRGSSRNGDFLLKAPAVALCDLFDRHGSFTIEAIQVQHGLPFKVTFEETVC